MSDDTEYGHLIYMQKKTVKTIESFNDAMHSSLFKQFDTIEKLKGRFSDLE